MILSLKAKSFHPALIKKFPKVDVKIDMIYLGWSGYSGMGLDVYAVKVIFEKFLKENKYFKVWRINWISDVGDTPIDWCHGKVVYYKYKR